MWSFVHHGTLFGSAIASGAAAVIVQLETIPVQIGLSQTDVATILAALAAGLATIAAVGRFEQKWQANRDTRVKLQELLDKLDYPDTTPNLAEIRAQLDAILDRHNKAISGGQQTQ